MYSKTGSISLTRVFFTHLKSVVVARHNFKWVKNNQNERFGTQKVSKPEEVTYDDTQYKDKKRDRINRFW